MNMPNVRFCFDCTLLLALFAGLTLCNDARCDTPEKPRGKKVKWTLTIQNDDRDFFREGCLIVNRKFESVAIAAETAGDAKAMRALLSKHFDRASDFRGVLIENHDKRWPTWEIAEAEAFCEENNINLYYTIPYGNRTTVDLEDMLVLHCSVAQDSVARKKTK